MNDIERGRVRWGATRSKRRAHPPAEVTCLACVVVVLVLFAVAGWEHRWMTEDAFINVRIVDNLLAGDGPVFNRGQRVEAGTSPLWLAVLAVARASTVGKVDTGWLCVVLGLALSTLGLAMGVAGARWAASHESGPAPRFIPAGLLFVIALPPMWDFATSGLETSLGFAWLGLCFWLLARRAQELPARHATRPRVLPVVIGLGPLIRPDFAIFSAAFLLVLLFTSAPSRLGRLRACALAFALPVVLEVARTAYFGSLLPNTAIAKEASAADWARGWNYLADFSRPYLVLVPLGALLVVLAGMPWQTWRSAGDCGRIAVVAAPITAGLASVVYVTRLGGDFMHARMLLPGVFSMTLPLLVWVPARDRAGHRASNTIGLVAVGILTVWAATTAAVLRVPYRGGLSPSTAISDERGFYVDLAGKEHPITAEDYRNTEFGRFGELLRLRAAEGIDVLVLEDGTEYPLPSGSGVVAAYGHIGIAGVLAGDDVHIIDPLGLTDPVAARMKLTERGRPGHEKDLPRPWVLAIAGVETTDPQVTAARGALDCGMLRELNEATSSELTPWKLAGNAVHALSLTFLRVDPDPATAFHGECD